MTNATETRATSRAPLLLMLAAAVLAVSVLAASALLLSA